MFYVNIHKIDMYGDENSLTHLYCGGIIKLSELREIQKKVRGFI